MILNKKNKYDKIRYCIKTNIVNNFSYKKLLTLLGISKNLYNAI